MQEINDLLSNLSNALGCSKLQLDSNNSCLINFPAKKIKITITPATDDPNNILVASYLGKIAGGPYRSSFFKSALVLNGLEYVAPVILSFNEITEEIALHNYILVKSVDGEKLKLYLDLFLEYAVLYSDHLLRGEIPNTHSTIRNNNPLVN